ncbi:hypothetical protein [Actinoplanes philippinensis]|uniref:hypothetical protein n=1 Tax=Actinoplanes philippinensis TaxID=35752 RepID=UPI0033C77A74
MAAHAYGFPADATGLVLAMTSFDRFAERLPDVAHAMLDIFATRSRAAQADDEQLICLIQSTALDFSLPPVAGTPVLWNRAERSSSTASLFDLPPEPPQRSWWRRSR